MTLKPHRFLTFLKFSQQTNAGASQAVGSLREPSANAGVSSMTQQLLFTQKIPLVSCSDSGIFVLFYSTTTGTSSTSGMSAIRIVSRASMISSFVGMISTLTGECGKLM